MKKFFLVVLSLLFITAISAQDAKLYVHNQTTPYHITDLTLANAGADTFDIEIFKDKYSYPVCWSLHTYGAVLTGTMEFYVDIYGSNLITSDTSWNLIATRVAEDTINASNLAGLRTDTDGYDYRYLRIIRTCKAQAQTGFGYSYLYLWRKP